MRTALVFRTLLRALAALPLLAALATLAEYVVTPVLGPSTLSVSVALFKIESLTLPLKMLLASTK